MIDRIKIMFALASAVLSSVSCLDKLPADSVPDTKAMRTLSDAGQIVNGIYSAFKSNALYSGNLTLLPDIQCDMVYAVEGYTNTHGKYWRWEFLANDAEIEDVYASLYLIIGRCNFFFAYVDKVRASLTDDNDLDELQELEGDVYFARALAYSELVKMYCKAYDPATAENEPGVVLVSDYYNPGPAVRANLRDSYQFILDDLAMAEKYVVRKSTTYVSLFTDTVVNSLYARVYLYMQNWSKAAEYASKVIDNENGANKTPYPTLSSATQYNYSTTMSDYEYMWHYDMGADIIWRVGFTVTSYGGALGRVFLNYNWVYYRPDYVVSDAMLSTYVTADRRKGIFFANFSAIGYDYTLTQPLLVKYYGNQNFLANNILHVSMPKPFRVSEQYLIRAEARCRMAENGEPGASFAAAASDISVLRAARYDGGSSATLNADSWLDVISGERARELFMEGFRLHDLKRWHRGFSRTRQTGSISEGSSLKIAADDPRFVWPIPQHEIDSPGSNIVQN